MKKFLRKLGATLPFCLLLLTGTLFGQSPWTRNKAGFYVQAGWHFIPAYEDVFPSKKVGTAPLDRRLSEGTFQLYGEYGLSNRTTAIVALPLRFYKSGEFLGHYPDPQTAAGSLSALGNVSLALRHNLINKKIPLSFSLRLDLPTAGYDDPTGLRTGYDAWTILPMLSTGIGLRNAYGFVYGGYGFRTNDYSHFVNAGIEGGIKVWKLWLIGFSELIEPLRNRDKILPVRNQITSLYVNDQAYLSVGFKGIFAVNRFVGILVSAAGAARAELVPKSPGIGVGVSFKWD